MCEVNVTEFRNNLPHYLKLAEKEDIIITKHGNQCWIVKKKVDEPIKK